MVFRNQNIIDLVFYNYILKCFVLIDLKTGKLSYQDVGQIDFYVRYFEEQIKAPEDNPTIGIVLCSDKNDTIVKYSVLSESSQLFASKYMLYMPSEDELKAELVPPGVNTPLFSTRYPHQKRACESNRRDPLRLRFADPILVRISGTI